MNPSLTRCLSLVLFTVGFSSARAAASQEGENCVQATLDLVARHEAQRARLDAPAEQTARRLLAGGRFFLAGDPAWVAEASGRAGGLLGVPPLKDVLQIQAGDVVWLADSTPGGNEFAALVHDLCAKKCLVVFFGDASRLPLPENCLSLGTLASPTIERHQRLLGNILSLWTETAELAATTARQDRTLIFLESHSVDGGRERNAGYKGALFHDQLPKMGHVAAGVLSQAFLQSVRDDLTALRDRELPALVSLGKEIARRSHGPEKPVLMGLSHVLPEAVPHESPLYRYVSFPEERAQVGQALKQDGLFIFLGYVSVPLDLWKAVHGAGATAAWIVAPLPGDADFRQFGDTVIDQHWQIGDAAVTVPGYDIRILPPSGIVQLVVFDTLMAVAENPTAASQMPDARPAGISAVHTDSPVVVDGRLDDPVWTIAPAYALSAVPGAGGARPPLQEGGTVRFAWNDRYLYIALEFTDSDVVAEGNADGLYHYRLGDVGEIFLKPSGAAHYWEFYVTPKGRQTTFYYPSRGRLLLPSCLLPTNDLVVAAQVQGTLNDYRDRDHGWTAEMAVPIAMLTAQGDTVGPGSRWTVQAGRYNYSAYLSAMELSSMPALSQGNFHLVEEFAPLRFDPAPPSRQTPR